MKKYTITVAGAGYVGTSIAAVLGRHHRVRVIDVKESKVSRINQGLSATEDTEIDEFLQNNRIEIEATTDPEKAYADADLVIVAVPTDYKSTQGSFDTRVVEKVLREVREVNGDALIIIKSTVPMGFTGRIREELNDRRIMFSPEFLRETRTLEDMLYPSRIVVGTDRNDPELMKGAETIVRIFTEASEKKDVKSIITGFSEAESIKLFSNTYLALRVAFFNELDTYAESYGMDTGQIIEGVCMDERIGDYYNNPSFGYGGYCLPKDTKQLLATYDGIPENIIKAIVESNLTRREYIADRVAEMLESPDGKSGETVGVFRLIMKRGSDNFRGSSIHGVIESLLERGIDVIVYEPSLENTGSYSGCRIVNDLDEFKRSSAIIIANRYDSILDDVRQKVYTRDLFERD